MKASVKIAKVDPKKKYLGKLVYDANVEGVKIAIIYMNPTGDIVAELNDDKNERYTIEPKAIIQGIVLAGLRKIVRETNLKILRDYKKQQEAEHGNNGKN